jgi:hypothetical protein
MILLNVIMLNVIMLSVVMLSVVMLNVVMLNVVTLSSIMLSVITPHNKPVEGVTEKANKNSFKMCLPFKLRPHSYYSVM